MNNPISPYIWRGLLIGLLAGISGWIGAIAAGYWLVTSLFP